MSRRIQKPDTGDAAALSLENKSTRTQNGFAVVALTKTPMRLSAESSTLKTGVYMIRNRVNGKVYVGSAAVDIERRFGLHRSQLRRGVHHSTYLQSAWNKYGAESFEFVVIARCLPEWCVAVEQIQIGAKKAANPDFGYNMTATAGSFRGMKHSAETRLKMSAWQIGKKMSQASIDKRRATMAKNGVSDELRKELSERAKKLLANPIIREKMNKGIRRYWENPNRDHVEKMKASAFSKDAIAKRSAAIKGVKLTEDHRRKISLATIGKKISDSTRLAMSIAQKKRYANPEEREKLRRIAKEYAEKNREQLIDRGRRIYASLKKDPITGRLIKKNTEITNGVS